VASVCLSPEFALPQCSEGLCEPYPLVAKGKLSVAPLPQLIEKYWQGGRIAADQLQQLRWTPYLLWDRQKLRFPWPGLTEAV
jgi:hypothetical protein